MQVDKSILVRFQKRQMKWYEHLIKTDDSRCLKKIYQRTLHARSRRRRPQKSGKSQEMDFMRNINTEDFWQELYFTLGNG